MSELGMPWQSQATLVIMEFLNGASINWPLPPPLERRLPLDTFRLVEHGRLLRITTATHGELESMPPPWNSFALAPRWLKEHMQHGAHK